MKDEQYCVYIITNAHNTTLYTGVTNNLARCIQEHKDHVVGGFTHKYNLEKLVYFEVASSINEAILREKQIKAGSRQKKIDMVESLNPDWEDLVDGLFYEEN